MIRTWVCLLANLNIFDILTADVSEERFDTVLTETSRTSIVHCSHTQLSSRSFKVLSKSDLGLYFSSKDNTHRNVTLTHEHSKTQFSQSCSSDVPFSSKMRMRPTCTQKHTARMKTIHRTIFKGNALWIQGNIYSSTVKYVAMYHG